MASSFFRDDNAQPLRDPQGLRPDFATIVKAASGAAIAETSIATLNLAANQTERKQSIVRVVVVGTNPCYFSLGAASAAPGDTSTMLTLLGNSVNHFKALPTDASMYLKQITGASSVEVCAMV